MSRLLSATPIALEADRFTASLMREMLPAARDSRGPALAGRVRALRSWDAAPPSPERAPTLRVSGVAFWIDAPASSRVAFRNVSGSVHGSIDRASSRAELRVSPRIADDERMDPGIAFGVVVSLLASRLGHALVHAAGVIAPSGRAWLLVGDSHSGKSTTTATLIAGGWDYLGDDSVVLSPAHGDASGARVHVEGWRVPIRVDRGSMAGATRADRVEVDPHALGGGRWRASAPLGGLLFPCVDRAARTTVAPIARAEAYAALVRQSPWLLADPASAPRVSELLSAASVHCNARLTLGADCYADAGRMIEVLGALTGV